MDYPEFWPKFVSSANQYADLCALHGKIRSKRFDSQFLHATVLRLLGYDHERFTYKYQGLEQRLSGVEPAQVIKELLA